MKVISAPNHVERVHQVDYEYMIRFHFGDIDAHVVLPQTFSAPDVSDDTLKAIIDRYVKTNFPHLPPNSWKLHPAGIFVFKNTRQFDNARTF